MPTIDSVSQISPFHTHNESSSYDFEMGSLLFLSGGFRKSNPYLQKAMQAFLEKKDFSSYLSCYSQLMQSWSELGEQEELKKLTQNFEEVCKIHNISNTVSILTCLAYKDINESKFDSAKKNLNEALKLAFESQDEAKQSGDQLKQIAVRFEIMKCLYTYSIYYFQAKSYENALKELENIKILLKDYFDLQKDIELERSKTENVQILKNYNTLLETLKNNLQSIQRIQLHIKYMEALIESNYKKDYKKAEQFLWSIYEEANKTNYTFFIPYILCSMACNYIKLDNKKEAQMLFNLAEKNLTEDRKLLMQYMQNLKIKENFNQKEPALNYDIIFDLKNHIIVEKEKGCIELKNQFILMDLLKLFLLNPGIFYSKENIVKEIWNQDYLPKTHDNKIYVTIKRLREIIEVNSCTPRYICRNHSGYHFSTQAKVLVKQ